MSFDLKELLTEHNLEEAWDCCVNERFWELWGDKFERAGLSVMEVDKQDIGDEMLFIYEVTYDFCTQYYQLRGWESSYVSRNIRNPMDFIQVKKVQKVVDGWEA